jgi:hypothetical protein
MCSAEEVSKNITVAIERFHTPMGGEERVLATPTNPQGGHTEYNNELRMSVNITNTGSTTPITLTGESRVYNYTVRPAY